MITRTDPMITEFLNSAVFDRQIARTNQSA